MSIANNATKDTPHTPHEATKATPENKKLGGDFNRKKARDNSKKSKTKLSERQRHLKLAKRGLKARKKYKKEKQELEKKLKKPKHQYSKNADGRTVYAGTGTPVGRPLKRELPPPRQIVLIKKLKEVIEKIENGEKDVKINMGQLMRESGYSDAYAQNPNALVESNSFQKLLNKHMPDDTVTRVHGEALVSEKIDHYVFPAGEKDSVIRDVIESVAGCRVVKIRKKLQWKRAYFTAPDTSNRLKAIQEAYKVKGRYPAEKHEHFVAKVEITKYV